MVLFALFVTGVDSIAGLSLTKNEKKFFQEIFSMLNKNIPSNFRDIHLAFKNYSDRSLAFLSIIKGNKELMRYLKKRGEISIEVNGTTLMELGVPTEEIGGYIDELFVLKLLGKIKNKEDEVKYIKRILTQR